MSGGVGNGAGVAVPASDGDQDPLGASGVDEPSEGRMNAADMAAFRRFQGFLRTEEATGSPPARRGRRRRRDDDEDEEEEGRGSSGPPPTWDGLSSFEDFHIKAKLWLAATKVKPKAGTLDSVSRSQVHLLSTTSTLPRMQHGWQIPEMQNFF